MKFLHTLHTDLRERQILPAVLVLAVLVIAIPIGASIELSKVTTPPPVSIVPPRLEPAKGVAPPAQELSSLAATPVVAATTRHGVEPDPFRQAVGSVGNPTAPVSSSTQPKTSPPKSTSTTSPVTTTPVTTTPATTTPATTTPAAKRPTKTPPTKTTPAKPKSKPTEPETTKPKSGGSGAKPTAPALVTPTTGPTKLKATQAYAVNIDTKDATGSHALMDVVRLAPLPAAQSPEVIYLGVLQGAKKAAFLFTNSVKVSGESGKGLTCLPSPSDCQIVELSPGQGMKLAPTSNTALIATFTFELMSIGTHRFSSSNAAVQARDAVSTAGAALIALSTSTELATLGFDESIGALVHQVAPSAGTTGASGSTGSTGASGSTGATSTGPTNAERFPRGVAFVLRPMR